MLASLVEVMACGHSENISTQASRGLLDSLGPQVLESSRPRQLIMDARSAGGKPTDFFLHVIRAKLKDSIV